MIRTTKIKMSQLWQGEKVIPVTYLALPDDQLAQLQVDEKVRLSGFSKGRGFAGVVKRHHFAGGPKTHGQSDRWRAPGSLGGTTTPGRVYKGKRMAGRLGGEKRTQKTIVVEIDREGKKLAVLGPVPGRRGSLIWLEKIS